MSKPQELFFDTPLGVWSHRTRRPYTHLVITRGLGPEPSRPYGLAFAYDQDEADERVRAAKAQGHLDVAAYPVTRTRPAKSARKSLNGIIDWES